MGRGVGRGGQVGPPGPPELTDALRQPCGRLCPPFQVGQPTGPPGPPGLPASQPPDPPEHSGEGRPPDASPGGPTRTPRMNPSAQPASNSGTTGSTSDSRPRWRLVRPDAADHRPVIPLPAPRSGPSGR